MNDSRFAAASDADRFAASDLRVSVLIPVYNSEHTIGPLVDAVVDALASSCRSLEIVLVNDGSRDRSHEAIRALMTRHRGSVRYVRLARNFGEHNAVMCGLHYVSGDCVAIIDDDFQNPPDQILRLIHRLTAGFDVVYAIYEKKHHSWFRNLGSRFNDRVATWLIGKPRDLYLSSFKVLNRFLIDAVTTYEGPYPYLDGLILRSTRAIGQQPCRHAARDVGQSNYTLVRLLRLWLNMASGFSLAPLRAASLLGLVMSVCGFAMAIFFIVSWSVGGIFRIGVFPPGWASLIVTVTVFAGLQLCVLGVIGEYLGRVFQTLSRSPQFVVRDAYGVSKEKSRS